MKYRLEFTARQAGGPAWEFYGTFDTRSEAEKVAKTLRSRHRATTRIVQVADGVASIGVTKDDRAGA